MNDVDAPRPGTVRSIGYMIASFPLRLVQFVLIVTLAVVGIATTVVWVGIPVLMAATALVRGSANHERRWVSRMLKTPLPPVEEPDVEIGAFQRWRMRLTDATTWRDLLYFLIAFPLSIVEFVFALAGIVIVPIGLFVVPWMGWLHGQLAAWLLGPNRAQAMAVRAQRLQASRARGVDAAEAERKRIERDLHDGAQQRLVSLAMSLGRAQSKMDTDVAAARQLVDQAHLDAKLAVAELRDLARGIYPAVLADRGLDAALSALAAKCPVPVHVEVDASVIENRPPQAVETTAYFVVAEALTNVAKHAGAQQADVQVARTDDKISVTVTDDGKGGAELNAAGGLSGLADRAAVIDGVITVVSPSGGPTVLRADLPCTW